VPEYVEKYRGRIAALEWKTPDVFAQDFNVPLRLDVTRIHGW